MNAPSIEVCFAGDLRARSLLSQHPKVARTEGVSTPGIQWISSSGARRSIQAGIPTELSGLVELADNNPLVCADAFSVPGPAATLALIALGPVIRAGIITDDPGLQFSFLEIEDSLSQFLVGAGWHGDLAFDSAVLDLKSVRALNAIVPITTGTTEDDILELYAESYERSFFIRKAKTWDIVNVLDTPFAEYQIRVLPGDDGALLTVQVMADINGKLGAAQLVHAMNVMSGFEESLGIA